jgi:sirohydrochlorin cobaltochelatase
VIHPSYSDAALVLLGHGTTQNEGSCAPVYQHAAELRRRQIFAEVREAFWKQEPHVKEVLAGLAAPRVFIVPLFICEGYFCEDVIPRELGFSLSSDPASRITHRASRSTYYCKPVGTHDSLTAVLLARAREVVEKFPFPRAPKPKDITLFIAGHGTERSENSRKAIEDQVKLLRTKGNYAAVHGIFMEESPRISDCHRLAPTRNIVVVPFFMSDGLHTQEDIPVLLGEPERIVKARLASGQPTWRNPTEKNEKLIWYAPAIGSEPHLADVILERVAELAAQR